MESLGTGAKGGKVLFTFLPFYLFTLLPFYPFTFKVLFTFLLFYPFTFKSTILEPRFNITTTKNSRKAANIRALS